MPCEDFTVVIGKNVVQVVYDFELLRVCWRAVEGPAAGDQVCYGGEDIIRFRDFINERRDRSVTAIVNEFQRFFSIRRQRAFWIVESMLDPRWCVLEVVVEPGCIIWGNEYTRSTYEFGVCLESVVDEDDVVMQLYNAMEEYDIKILDRCGKGAKYGIRMRRIKREEAGCGVIHTDYYTWIRETVAEIASFTTA